MQDDPYSGRRHPRSSRKESGSQALRRAPKDGGEVQRGNYDVKNPFLRGDAMAHPNYHSTGRGTRSPASKP